MQHSEAEIEGAGVIGAAQPRKSRKHTHTHTHTHHTTPHHILRKHTTIHTHHTYTYTPTLTPHTYTRQIEAGVTTSFFPLAGHVLFYSKGYSASDLSPQAVSV